MRPILVVCSLPDEHKDRPWHVSGNVIPIREALADVLRFGQSNGTPVYIPKQDFCTRLAVSLGFPFQSYTDADHVVFEQAPSILFIGGGDDELTFFHRMKSSDCFLLPLPFTTGAASVMYEEICDRFSEDERNRIVHARFASEILFHFLHHT